MYCYERINTSKLKMCKKCGTEKFISYFKSNVCKQCAREMEKRKKEEKKVRPKRTSVYTNKETDYILRGIV